MRAIGLDWAFFPGLTTRLSGRADMNPSNPDEYPAQHLRAALSDRYTIESEIDSGGMATVYRARDLKHERTVAIKVLRPDLAEAIGADRFLREIRTTANLSHPHILPLHDSGEADGFLYYVMPFVKGESLRDRLEREGQLPVEDAVQIAREVSDALAYAHKNGVVHRDIKPANIMLDEGHAMLADFGIAQAKAGAQETKLTGSGMSLGTPSYMSPEQASGDEKLDGRSDQYSLACVLFEMLAGHPPFTGAGVQTILRQHLAADPPLVTQARASVPGGVAKAIQRALAKSPADRFRTVGEFEKALAGATLPLLARIPMGKARAVVFGGGSLLVFAVAVLSWILVFRSPSNPGDTESSWQPDPTVVVVAPFKNRTGDPAYDDLGDWAAASVRDRLDRAEIGTTLSEARVMPLMARAESEADLITLFSRDLGAGTVVTGSIFLRADSLVIQASVDDAVSGGTLFSVEPARGLSSDEEALIRQIQDRVAGGLALHFDPDNPLKAVSSPPLNPEAYREWKRGMELRENFANWADVPDHFLRAWALDSTFLDAALDAVAALNNVQTRNRERDSVLAVLEGKRDQMTRAQGFTFDSWTGDFQTAVRVLRQASESNPTEWAYNLGHTLMRLNRMEEAVEAFQLWEKEDGEYLDGYVDFWPIYFQQYAEAMHCLGRHEKELELALEGRRRSPDDPLLLEGEILARVALGQVEEARDLVREMIRGGRTRELIGVVEEFFAHGFHETAREILEGEVQAFGSDPFYADAPNLRANVLMMLDRNEEAYALAEGVFHDEKSGMGQKYGARTLMGITAARMGDTIEAMAADEWIQETPYSSAGQSRAQIRAVLGDFAGAVEVLEQALYRDGYNFNINLHRRLNLLPLRGYPPFDELMAPRG